MTEHDDDRGCNFNIYEDFESIRYDGRSRVNDTTRHLHRDLYSKDYTNDPLLAKLYEHHKLEDVDDLTQNVSAGAKIPQ